MPLVSDTSSVSLRLIHGARDGHVRHATELATSGGVATAVSAVKLREAYAPVTGLTLAAFGYDWDVSIGFSKQ